MTLTQNWSELSCSSNGDHHFLVPKTRDDLVHVQEELAWGRMGMVSIPLGILAMTSSAYFFRVEF